MKESNENPKMPANLERTATSVDSMWRATLDALRNGQPLALLASVSLVIAAFGQNVSEAAVSYAVSASLAFLVALGFSFFVDMRRGRNPTAGIEYAAAALVATVAGFIMLALVAVELGIRYDLARRIFSFTVGSLTVFVFAVAELRIWDSARSMEQAKGARPTRVRLLQFLRASSLAVFAAFLGSWVGFTFGFPILEWPALTTMTGLLVILVLVRYLERRK